MPLENMVLRLWGGVTSLDEEGAGISGRFVFKRGEARVAKRNMKNSWATSGTDEKRKPAFLRNF